MERERFLIDSDWMIDRLNGDRQAQRLIDPLLEQGASISIITFGELYDGVLRDRFDPAKEERRFLAWIDRVELPGLDRMTMRIYADVRGRLRARGELSGDNDLLIASTALRHDLTLVTRNRRHFDRIPGLRIHESGPAE